MSETVNMTTTEVLPLSGKTVVFRGMTGHEEDLLTNKKLLKKGEAIDKIIHGCVVELDGKKPSESDIQSMKTDDRTFLLVNIRRMSYGDVIEDAEVACREKGCTEKSYYDIDLSEFPVTVVEGGAEDREFEFTLPVTKTLVKFRDMDGSDEKKVAKHGEEEILTIGMMLRITEVEGVHPNSYKKWLKGLPVRDRSALRKEMEKYQVGIDTTITSVCEECGTETKVRAESLMAFFFPEM